MLKYRRKTSMLLLSAVLLGSVVIPTPVAMAIDPNIIVTPIDPIIPPIREESIIITPPFFLNQGILRWAYFINSGLHSAVIGTDGTIYVGTDDGKLYAMNPDGSKRWDFPIGPQVSEVPAIGADGTVYAGSSKNKKFYAINPDGSEKWVYETGFAPIAPAKVGADGTIYVGFGTSLFAIRPDGTKKWEYAAKSYINAAPAINTDGTIYVASKDNKLHAIKPNGKMKWIFTETEKGGMHAGPTIGSDGTIYVGSDDSRLYAIWPDGFKKWVYEAGEVIITTPVIGTDGTIYIGSREMLHAVNSDGKQKWTFPTTGFVNNPKIDAAGTIYIGSSGSSDQKLYAVKPDGKLKWEYLTDTGFHSSPVIGADGTVYIGNYGRFYAIYSLGTVEASSITVNKNAIQLKSGESETLTATVVPAAASNKNVAWSSSDGRIASVDSMGKVTGVSSGTATITVTAVDGGFIATCQVTVTAPANQSPSFSDITGHWAAANVTRAVELKIASGYPDGTFLPDGSITRAEFCVMLMNGLQPTVQGMPLKFKDTEKIGGWAAKAVAQAVQLGITSGYQDGTFRPGAQITHSEMIVMVVKALGLPVDPDAKTGFADDTEIPNWAKGAAATAEHIGITGYITNNRFEPKMLATRAEALTAILNMLDFLGDGT